MKRLLLILLLSIGWAGGAQGANPTTAKPAAYFPSAVQTSSTVGELAVCDVAINTEVIRDSVGNVLARPLLGINGPAGGFGYPPRYNATGYTAGSVSNQPCLTFEAGSTALAFNGRAFTGALSYPFTMWIEVRVRMAGLTSLNFVPLWGTGGTNPKTISLQVATDGTITVGEQQSNNFASSAQTIVRDKWYLIAVTYTSSTGRILQIYNRTDQAFVTTEATGLSYTGQSPGGDTTNMAVLNPQRGDSGVFSPTFIGDVAGCGISTATWNPATNGYFAAMVADPWLISRGSTPTGGAMTANGCVNASKNKTEIQIVANRPNGGTAASYQWRLHRSTSTGFTPNSGTRIGSLQSSPILVDTPTDRTRYYYKTEMTDGSSTVYSTTATTNYSQVSGRRPVGDFFFGLISDSRYARQGNYIVTALAAKGYRVGCVDMGLGNTYVKTATTSLSWQPNDTQNPTNGQPGTTLLAKAMQMFTDAGNVTHVFSALGINDMGAGTSASTFLTNYGYIRNVITGGGFKIILHKPWEPAAAGSSYETAYIELGNYWTGLAALANGSTIFCTGDDIQGVVQMNNGMVSFDNLHLSTTFLDAIATASEIARVVLGETTTGGYPRSRVVNHAN